MLVSGSSDMPSLSQELTVSVSFPLSNSQVSLFSFAEKLLAVDSNQSKSWV